MWNGEEACWFLTALLICMVVRFVIINVQASIKQTAQAWRLIKALLICMVARLVETKFQAWVEQFLVWTLLICMVAVLPAILHNISVAVYLCIRGHLICSMVRLAAIR